MGFVKALLFGWLAGLGVGTLAHDVDGLLGDVARWHSLHFIMAGMHWFLSIPIFIGVALFAWGFIAWSRQ